MNSRPVVISFIIAIGLTIPSGTVKAEGRAVCYDSMVISSESFPVEVSFDPLLVRELNLTGTRKTCRRFSGSSSWRVEADWRVTNLSKYRFRTANFRCKFYVGNGDLAYTEDAWTKADLDPGDSMTLKACVVWATPEWSRMKIVASFSKD